MVVVLPGGMSILQRQPDDATSTGGALWVEGEVLRPRAGLRACVAAWRSC